MLWYALDITQLTSRASKMLNSVCYLDCLVIIFVLFDWLQAPTVSCSLVAKHGIVTDQSSVIAAPYGDDDWWD